MSQYLQQICVPLRSHGFTDVNVDEIVRSIRCLAKHGILTLDTNITKPAKSPPPAIWNQDSSVPGKSYKIKDGKISKYPICPNVVNFANFFILAEIAI